MDTFAAYTDLRLREELKPLFQQDLSLPEEAIRGILALPREDLLDDLCLILSELPANEQDLNEVENAHQAPTSDVLNPERSFAVHALNLLAALRAVEKWPVINDFLMRRDLPYWLGPYIELGLWEVLFDLMRDCYQELGALLQEGQLANELRIPVLNALVQVAWHLPIHRRAVLVILTEVMEALLAGDLPADPAFAGELVREVRDLRAERLLPVIRRLYEQGMVQTAVAGTLEAVEAGMTGSVRSQAKRPHLNIYQRYEVYRSQHRLSAPEDEVTAVKMEKAQPAKPG